MTDLVVEPDDFGLQVLHLLDESQADVTKCGLLLQCECGHGASKSADVRGERRNESARHIMSPWVCPESTGSERNFLALMSRVRSPLKPGFHVRDIAVT